MGATANSSTTGASKGPPNLADPQVWDRLVEWAGPASLLTFARSRMGGTIAALYRPEDVLQDALLSVWSSRAKVKWRGQRAFRGLLLRAIENRLYDLAKHGGAVRRGGGRATPALSQLDSGHAPPDAPDTVTPGRIAMYREEAEAIRAALEELDAPTREILTLRLIEQLDLAEIAGRVDLTLETVRYRFRTGSVRFRGLLLGKLGRGSSGR